MKYRVFRTSEKDVKNDLKGFNYKSIFDEKIDEDESPEEKTKYYIDISSLEELEKFRKTIDERLIIQEHSFWKSNFEEYQELSIEIYDDYRE